MSLPVKTPSRAIVKLYGRKYGYIPTIVKSKALDRLRWRELRSEFLIAMDVLKKMIEREHAK